MFDNWQWLRGTYWYVPTENLTAPIFSLERKPPLWLSDQTVWQIDDYANGYASGSAAVRMQPTTPGANQQSPRAQFLTASITPEGNVHMTFIPYESSGSAGSVGVGHMRWRDGMWTAEMQMSSPLSDKSVILHWAYMLQCKPEDEAWQQLPGTDQSLPEFLEAAGLTLDSK
jgi:hypothetical protein